MAKKILVVDDEEKIVKMVETRLKASGYEVLTAYDGSQGLQKATQETPDLIVLDIMMPGVDGTDMAQSIRINEETKNIPIIFLTCLIDKQEADDIGHKIAGDLFLAKPFDANELLSMIDKVLTENK
ncbi:response regulator transcription factor [Candidatus Omnitrophota bacterium]